MSDPAPAKPDLGARIVTGVVGAVAVTAVILYVPADLAFGVWLLATTLAAGEFVRIGRHFAPTAPLGVIWGAVPVAAIAGFWGLRGGVETSALAPLAALFATVLFAALVNLFSTAELRDAAVATFLGRFRRAVFRGADRRHVGVAPGRPLAAAPVDGVGRRR